MHACRSIEFVFQTEIGVVVKESEVNACKENKKREEQQQQQQHEEGSKENTPITITLINDCRVCSYLGFLKVETKNKYFAAFTWSTRDNRSSWLISLSPTNLI